MSNIKNTADLIQCDTNNIIHGVKVITYDQDGTSNTTYINGDKLHEYVYNSKTKKFNSIESLQRPSPFSKKETPL
jgi:hypothetical protein